MLNTLSDQPIGIFDSGVGGLTIAQALVKTLPYENIIYFGDTAHMPYGDRSTSAIQSYAVKIAQLLLQQDCKLILIACNSASAVAFNLVKEYVADKALVMNVIDPMIHYLAANYGQKRIGLIGTKATVNSNIYQQKIAALNLGIKLTAQATNLLASAIEEFGNHSLIDSLLMQYLSHQTLQNIDALLLACTHYPIVKDKIQNFYQSRIEIIDPCEIIARQVKKRLTEANLLKKEGAQSKRFFVSDYTESFARSTKLFFNDEIKLEHYRLWE